MTRTTPALELNNATFDNLVALLRDQHQQRSDMIQRAGRIYAEGGRIYVEGDENVLISMDGVSRAGYNPTAIFMEGVADKLGIPLPYVRKMYATLPELWDRNVNAWLHHAPDKKFMIRTFPGVDGNPGIARALLSDRYQIIDNFDVLTAAMRGIQRAGVDVKLSGDLTERRMHVRAVATNLEIAAPQFLETYRAPNGNRGADNPMISAGAKITNSELGGGAYTISPYIVVQVCTNGMTVNNDAQREVHLGGRHAVGTIQWSADTNRRQLDLITAKTTDAIKHFFTPGYLSDFIDGITAQAAVRVEQPEPVVNYVCKQLGFSEDQRNDVFAHFLTGGDITAGGVMQAVTSVAQIQPDGDKRADMEGRALDALALAARPKL